MFQATLAAQKYLLYFFVIMLLATISDKLKYIYHYIENDIIFIQNLLQAIVAI